MDEQIQLSKLNPYNMITQPGVRCLYKFNMYSGIKTTYCELLCTTSKQTLLSYTRIKRHVRRKHRGLQSFCSIHGHYVCIHLRISMFIYCIQWMHPSCVILCRISFTYDPTLSAWITHVCAILSLTDLCPAYNSPQ